MVYPDCPCTDSDSKTDRKEKKQEERRRGRSMRTTRLTKIAMVISVSYTHLAFLQNTGGTYMARSMITGRETQKMQEYTQERINQAEDVYKRQG